MAQPSNQNLVSGLDPTGFASITPSQLLQMIQSALTYADKGMIVITTDTGITPVVPDAAVTNTEWQRFIWLRVMASSVTAYVWNVNGVSDATFLKWQSITVAAIADGSITTNKLADLAVTDVKVNDISWSKITGIPALVVGGTVAGGDLSGTYPNPTIAANAVDSTKLKSDATIDANRAVTTDSIKYSAVTTPKINPLAVTVDKIALGTALQQLRTNGAGNAVEWFTPPLSNTFVSGVIAFPTTNTIIDTPHSLGARPKFVRVVGINTIAELGYTVNDEVNMECFEDSSGDLTFGIICDATNVSVNARGADAISVRDKGTHLYANITKTSWSFKIYASV